MLHKGFSKSQSGYVESQTGHKLATPMSLYLRFFGFILKTKNQKESI